MLSALSRSVRAFAILSLASLPAFAASYTLDGAHSRVGFGVKHMMVSTVRGAFKSFSGTIVIDDADLTKSTVKVEIDTASVDTGIEKRDEHLKSPDFFNSKEFPKLSFVSKSAKKASNGMFEVSGDLTMHGVTKPITAMVEVTGESSMMGARGGVEATFTIKRSEWGMTYGVDKGSIGDSVRVVVGLEGTKGK